MRCSICVAVLCLQRASKRREGADTNRNYGTTEKVVEWLMGIVTMRFRFPMLPTTQKTRHSRILREQSGWFAIYYLSMLSLPNATPTRKYFAKPKNVCPLSPGYTSINTRSCVFSARSLATAWHGKTRARGVSAGRARA